MLHDTKLMYNRLYIWSDEYVSDVHQYGLYKKGEGKFVHLPIVTTGPDYTLELEVGETYLLGVHMALTLLQGWQPVTHNYNVYTVTRKVPSALQPSKKVGDSLCECVEVNYFNANNIIEFFDFFYAD